MLPRCCANSRDEGDLPPLQCLGVLQVDVEAPERQRACEVDKRAIWKSLGVSRVEVSWNSCKRVLTVTRQQQLG